MLGIAPLGPRRAPAERREAPSLPAPSPAVDPDEREAWAMLASVPAVVR